jgi:hypothetical protein
VPLPPIVLVVLLDSEKLPSARRVRYSTHVVQPVIRPQKPLKPRLSSSTA